MTKILRVHYDFVTYDGNVNPQYFDIDLRPTNENITLIEIMDVIPAITKTIQKIKVEQGKKND